MEGIRSAGIRIATLFVALFVVSLPFPYFVLPDPGTSVAPLFEMLVRWSGETIFAIDRPYTSRIVSDSIGMYIHLFNLAVVAVVAGIVWHRAKGEQENDRTIAWLLRSGASCYLSLQLLRYGFEKVFKHQFYLPEPNTLFTPLGDLSPDILYWSTIGSSHSYSMFTGVVEIVPALLLLFERTRLLGALGAFGVMLHVLMINIGFDISVKIFSAFLLLLALLVAAPDAGNLYRFFIRREPTMVAPWRPTFGSGRSALLYAIFKGVLVGAFFFEALFIYFASGNFNDDLAPRPPLHGAYDVALFVRGGDTIAPLLGETRRPRRIFVHREGYLVTQGMDDTMRDYGMTIDTAARRLTLAHDAGAFDYSRSAGDSLLTLWGRFGGDSVRIVGRRIDLSGLPLLRGGFHWTIDRYTD